MKGDGELLTDLLTLRVYVPAYYFRGLKNLNRIFGQHSV